MNLGRHIGVVGSRDYGNYRRLCEILDQTLLRGDTIVSGGAVGCDSLAQRYAKEHGYSILIIYPDYQHEGRGATFIRNKLIVETSERIIAFYSTGKYQSGGTRNTIEWAIKLGIPYREVEEWSSGMTEVGETMISSRD